MAWECAIEGCGAVFEDVETMVAHQAADHDHHECEVCGTEVPDGFLAIRHALGEHTRAEYVRAYGASSQDIRKREELLEELEDVIDDQRLAELLE